MAKQDDPGQEGTPPPNGQTENLRAQLQAAAPGLAPFVIETLSQAILAKKTAKITEPCKKCGCAHWRTVEIPDAVAAANAVKVLIEAAEGRLGTSGLTGGPHVVIRRVGPRPPETREDLAFELSRVLAGTERQAWAREWLDQQTSPA